MMRHRNGRRSWSRSSQSDVDADPLRVLILSSSMGAGHDGAGNELIRRLEAEGHEARMHDYLDALPFGLGWMIRRNYQLQLRYAPWSYENSYHFMPRIYGLLVFLNAWLSRRQIERWMTEFPPDVLVSNNTLATLAIGRLRERRQLSMPTVTYITDFGVHPLWVHRGIDLHLAVHPEAAAAAHRQSGGGRAEAPGPLVGPAFRDHRPERRLARARLGLEPGDRAVLVVAGSWGVGEVEETARMLVESGRFIPVTVCGRDERLRRRMEADGLGIVIGWTDQMPSLMAAADALVENAGGLTSMEALAARLPVITFNPIPGHGRENAAAMARAGVTRWPQSADELLSVLDQVTAPGPERDRIISAGSAVFSGDAAADVVDLAEPGGAIVTLRRARHRRMGRRVVGATAATAAVYGTMTAGVALASVYGNLTVPDRAHPSRLISTPAGEVRPVAYVGVRLTPDEIVDGAVLDRVRRLDATVIITGTVALSDPEAVRGLAGNGVDVATGGWGRPRDGAFPEHVDVSSAHRILRSTGVAPSAYVPSRPVDALDLVWASRRHLTIVVPQHTLEPGRSPDDLVGGQRYVIDGRESTPAELVSMLDAVSAGAQAQGTVIHGLQAFEDPGPARLGNPLTDVPGHSATSTAAPSSTAATTSTAISTSTAVGTAAPTAGDG